MTKHGKIEKGICVAQLQLNRFKREVQQSKSNTVAMGPRETGRLPESENKGRWKRRGRMVKRRVRFSLTDGQTIASGKET